VEGERLAVERARDGTVLVRLAGTWSLSQGMPDIAPVERALAATPPPQTLAFDLARLEKWDTGVLAFVNKVEGVAAGRRVGVDRGGLPEAMRNLLALAETVPEAQGARVPRQAVSWLARRADRGGATGERAGVPGGGRARHRASGDGPRPLPRP
jgi:hypothetical protein